MKWCFGLVGLVIGVLPAWADLFDYVKKEDKAYSWKYNGSKDSDAGTVYEISMISQKWQGIEWDHEIRVYVPKGVKPGASMAIYNTGGKPDAINSLIGFDLSRRAQIPIAILYGIPKQPLYDGKKEDALIAETFVRYLKDGDEDWPLLFPMTKSLVRAMDTLQAFSKQEWKTELKTFVVTGASKRGWTSWLTAASDPRVKAVAPLVIDTLNFKEQLPYQIKSYGKPSEMIHDYTERGLVPIPKDGRGEKLWSMIDPWVYRDKLTMPKLIVNGANDPYWTLDALNLYWDDLKGEKSVLYVPNAGHGLDQVLEDGKKDRSRALNTIAAFARAHVLDEKFPTMTWKHDDAADGNCRLCVNANGKPKAVRVWVANSETRDFRKSKWEEKAGTLDKDSCELFVDKPKKGCRAFFAEMDFEIGGLTFTQSTQLRIVEAQK
jgi:PhoPQ-activated pathogenicity-related protein